MLNIEVIKFEAQDVITASVAAPCTHTWGPVTVGPNGITASCGECGVTGTLADDGSTFVPNN